MSRDTRFAHLLCSFRTYTNAELETFVYNLIKPLLALNWITDQPSYYTTISIYVVTKLIRFNHEALINRRKLIMAHTRRAASRQFHQSIWLSVFVSKQPTTVNVSY